MEVKSQPPNKVLSACGSSFNQLLNIYGTEQETAVRERVAGMDFQILPSARLEALALIAIATCNRNKKKKKMRKVATLSWMLHFWM
ncbi:hypothetical protein HHK36_031693 [Tetracentron sinense]|uniref:Uncharacterized protein n=1 Tax=Tetracentron sinense TaxID=13715 RepID=A0A834Y9W1_TETSI|nr:hypothetical protein HHK36_031693 [Tetracentron sinense]